MFSLIVLLIFVGSKVSFAEDDIMVTVSQGSLRGILLKTINGRDIYTYKSIPYAKPPLGELRFEPPVPIDPWEGVINATEDHPVCPQRNIYTRTDKIEGDENCLFLNVYTPNAPNASENRFPVMIFFHGGGWLCGAGDTHSYGPDHLLDKDIVLVIPNYRLGPMGFLSTEDEVVPGNMGLKDQNLVLKWVKQNIAVFGGDADKVTIFGESAGGASCHYHMLSPMSKGLFKAALSQSGTALDTWAFAPKGYALNQTKKLASFVECTTDDNKEMVKCLKQIDALKLIEQDRKFMTWDFDPMIPFKPLVEPAHEGAFLDEDPIDLIMAGKVAEVPWVLGINSEDGAIRVAGIYGNPHLVGELDEQFDRVVPISLEYDKSSNDIATVTKELRKFYFGEEKIDNSSRAKVVEMYTDGWFMQGSDDAIRLHTKYTKTPVYYYDFAFRGSCSFTVIFGDPVNDYGVCHADELQYLFPINFCTGKLADEDKPVVELLTTIWTNLAISGDPTPEVNDLIKKKWTPVQSDKVEYYFLKTSDTSEMREDLYSERSKLWRNLPIDTRREKFAQS